MAVADRLALLRAQAKLTGLDFIHVDPSQTTLDVFFLRDVTALERPLVGDVAAEQVRIVPADGGPGMIPATGVDWVQRDGQTVMRVTTAAPGGFEPYRLFVDDDPPARIDPYTNGVRFSFKAACDTELDCRERPPACPPEGADPEVAVDYRARDFWSFRRALLDFAADRHPAWEDRLEADAGVMLVEAMSALGDELAYYQDRIAREAHLETATQRRSLRRHARLVDYPVHNGTAATAWIRISAVAGQQGRVGSGGRVWTEPQSEPSVVFELGRGIRHAGEVFAVDAARDNLRPHIWDEDEKCLAIGSTSLYLDGHHAAKLQPRQWLLLETEPLNPAAEARAWPVQLAAVPENGTDPVIPGAGNVTRIEWEPTQALPFQLDLETLRVHGNLAPAVAGSTRSARFTVGTLAGRGPGDDRSDRPETVERTGPDGSVAHLFSLAGSDEEALAWLGEDPAVALPEIRLWELEWTAAGWSRRREWPFAPSLLDVPYAARSFTLEDGQWRRVLGFPRVGGEHVHRDYADARGATVRFGDGEFGLTPPRGTVFEVDYRVGGGLRSNVPAASLTHHDMSTALVGAVTNPIPARDGRDPEPAADVRRYAPEAFRALSFRAVCPDDYARAAERLEWVQRAGAEFRWTGSWLTAFVTPDPRDAAVLEARRRDELEARLDGLRQAGRETSVLDPVYADIDLEVTVCAAPDAYRGQVQERVFEELVGASRPGMRPPYFHPDNFTFGTPLRRPDLEAAIQRAPGVRAVAGMTIRRRGWHDWRQFSELRYQLEANELLRLANDPREPARGSLNVIVRGGA